MFGPLLGQFESQFGFLLRPRQPFLGAFSDFQFAVWSPGYGGKVGEQEGAEGVTSKSIPLGHKSGIFRREKKGNTYATSTHFPGFLQNQSNCKTVLYLRNLQPATVCHPPVGTVAMQYHIGRPGVSSLSPGDQIYPSFSGYSLKE